MVLLITIFIIGFTIGIFATNKVSNTNIINQSDNQKIVIFIDAFCINYWYLFIVWLMGFISIGFIITGFINFIKGLIQGIIFALLLKNDALFGIYKYFKFEILQWILIIPTLIILSNISIKYRYNQNNSFSYNKIFILVTLICIVFAFIVSLMSK